MSLADILQCSARPKTLGILEEVGFGYLRVSHQRSADKETSEATQRRLIEEHAASKGIRIKAWYIDRAKSAFKNEQARTEFLRMLDDANHDPEVSVVLVFKYDRFSRNWSAPAQQAELHSHGVRIESVTEGYFDPETETGAIMMPITWGLNRLQSLKLRSVVTPNMITNAQNRDPEYGWAYKNGGIPMWGYKVHRIKVGRSNKYTDICRAIWILDDTLVAGRQVCEWARIALIEWRLKQGLGYREIANRLTDLGIPTPRGKSAWCQSTVRSLIAEFDKLYQYAGYGFWYRRNCQTGPCQERDTSEWVVVENAHPSIISADEADAILATTKQIFDKPKKHNKPESRFILSGGTLRCGRCGSRFAGKKTDSDYYLCGSHIYRNGSGCGPSWYIRKDAIEDLVFRQLLNRVAAGRIEEWVHSANREIDAEWEIFKKATGERQKKLAALELELKNLLDVAAAVGNNDNVAERIREVTAAIDELKSLQGLRKPARLAVGDLVRRAERVARICESGQQSDRKAVARLYVKELIADPETRTIAGTLVDPLMIPDIDEDPEPDGSGSSICRYMVGQGTAYKTANSAWELARCYRKSWSQLIVATGDAPAPVLNMRPLSELTMAQDDRFVYPKRFVFAGNQTV